MIIWICELSDGRLVEVPNSEIGKFILNNKVIKASIKGN